MIRRDPPRRRPRFGFTLIELLVVIVIIGILISLLLPVIFAAVRRANEAKASAEIQTLATGLAKFKDTYGEFPPSRVILSEQGFYTASPPGSPNGNGTSVGPIQTDFTTSLSSIPAGSWFASTPPTNFGTPDISFGTLAQRSLDALRRMFTKAAFGPEVSTGYWPDFNGNNVLDSGYIYLEGHECLVFFLGGIPNPSNSSSGILYGTSGFGKEPRYPFKNAGVTPGPATTANRTTPSYEFRAERLIDSDGDGIPGYLDSYASAGVGQFFAYFAAYGGTGYDPNDMNSPTEVDDYNYSVGTVFRIGLATVPPASASVPPPPTIPAPLPLQTVFSPTPNPYTSGLPTPIDISGGFNANQPASNIGVNSFQIISSGGDGLFGPGGQWTSSGDRLPIPKFPPYPDQTSLRPREADNLSSFTSGRLN